MSRKVNWNTFEKNAIALKKRIKDIKGASAYLQNIPEEGLIMDNISKNIVKISDCKSSSLRRYVKVLDKYYYLITSEQDREKILNKKIEVENELNKRDDATAIESY